MTTSTILRLRSIILPSFRTCACFKYNRSWFYPFLGPYFGFASDNPLCCFKSCSFVFVTAEIACGHPVLLLKYFNVHPYGARKLKDSIKSGHFILHRKSHKCLEDSDLNFGGMTDLADLHTPYSHSSKRI